MRKFEVCKGFENSGVNLPVRSTSESAGYDVEAIEDTVIPSIWKVFIDSIKIVPQEVTVKLGLPEPEDEDVVLYDKSDYIVKPAHLSFKDDAITISKGTLVKTGIKAYCNTKEYVALVSRSSNFNKKGLMLANNYGVSDADYPDNPENDGHLQFNFINFGFSDILIKKCERIGQILFVDHNVTDSDVATAKRLGGFGSTGA